MQLKYKTVRSGFIVSLTLICSLCIGARSIEGKSKSWINVIKDTCIYNKNTHAAFTSLEKYGDCLYLAFRDASHHSETPTDKGRIRILKNMKGEWLNDTVFEKKGVDLRDPFVFKWGNKMYLYTWLYFSEFKEGKWSEFYRVEHNAYHHLRIWKFREYKGELYGIGNSGGKWPMLLKSKDAKKWEVIDEFKLGGNASEADMVFIGDTMYICIRVDNPTGSNSMWGKSKYPFSSTSWTSMDISVASPEMILHNDSTILLAGREYDYELSTNSRKQNVSIYTLNQDGEVKNKYIVNSEGADQGYPSFLRIKKNQYLMSYYTGNEKTVIRTLLFNINTE